MQFQTCFCPKLNLPRHTTASRRLLPAKGASFLAIVQVDTPIHPIAASLEKTSPDSLVWVARRT